MSITKEQFDQFIRTLRLIAHGETSGPSGLEGIAIALAGDQFREPVGSALGELAAAIDRHAEAITDAADKQAGAITEAAQTIAEAIGNLGRAQK